jgi:hypothetical protein
MHRDQVPSKKTPEPALPSNKEPSVWNLKPSEGSHASASDSHISLEGHSTRYYRSNTSRVSILSEGANKTEKSSVSILKIAECPESDFLKRLEQCNLYSAYLASFSTTSCRGGRPTQENLHCCHRCGAHTACHTQASNPLDMTKLFFFKVVRCVFSTKLMRLKSKLVLLPKCISNTPPSVSVPIFFILPYGIGSKLYWPSVFCYRYKISYSVCYLE